MEARLGGDAALCGACGENMSMRLCCTIAVPGHHPQELLGLVEARLGGMRRSAERALGAAQALAAAEAAYARALGIVSRIPLAGDADGGPLHALLAAFRRLPEAVGAVHAKVPHNPNPPFATTMLVMLKADCVAHVLGAVRHLPKILGAVHADNQ